MFSTLLGIISSLHYELAIPIPETNKEAANVFVLSFLIIITLSLIASIVIYFLAGDITVALGFYHLNNTVSDRIPNEGNLCQSF